METEIYSDINPILRPFIQKQFKEMAERRKKKHGDLELEGYRKCNNCKEYYPLRQTTMHKCLSGKSYRRCDLCETTITGKRMRRK